MNRDNINISVENGVLTVEGTINFGKYEGLQPVYSEYNVGPSSKLSDFEPDRSGQNQRQDERWRDYLGVAQGRGSEAAAH